MAEPIVGHLVKWKLEPQEQHHADLLLPDQLRKYQTIYAELVLALAEFPIVKNNSTPDILNSEDYWLLRGRLTLVLEILEAHDAAMGVSQAAEEALSNGGTPGADSTNFQPTF